jgi:hypothetical protein
MTDIQLELIQRTRVKAKVYRQSFKEAFGLLGGFGSLDNLSNIATEMTEPVWIPDQAKPDKGRWSESVTYSAHMILRCPTPIQTRLIQTEVPVFPDSIDRAERLHRSRLMLRYRSQA